MSTAGLQLVAVSMKMPTSPLGSTMSNGISRYASYVAGPGSSIQDIARSFRDTFPAASVASSFHDTLASSGYQRAQEGFLGMSGAGLIGDRFGAVGVVSAARDALDSAGVANLRDVALHAGLSSVFGRAPAASQLESIGNAFPVAGIAASITKTIESSAFASVRDTFLTVEPSSPALRVLDRLDGTARERALALGGVSAAVERSTLGLGSIRDQLNAGGLATATQEAMEAAGASKADAASSVGFSSGLQDVLATTRIGPIHDRTPLIGAAGVVRDVMERAGLRTVHESLLSSALSQIGPDAMTSPGSTALQNAAVLAGVSPALQEAAARIGSIHDPARSVGIAGSVQQATDRAGLGYRSHVLSTFETLGFSSPLQDALTASRRCSIRDVFPLGGVAESVRESMERAGLAGQFGGALGGTILGGDIFAHAIGSLPEIAIARPIIEISEETRRRWEIAEEFALRWEGKALWYLLSPLSIDHHYRLAAMEEAVMEEALLAALENVVTEESFATELSSALDSVPFITAEQREDLQHGLEHAAEGKFGRALPPLMLGLEGALWSTGRAKALIDSERRLVVGPKQGREVGSIEQVIKVLPAEEGFSTFAIRRIFGGVGNPVRHGEATEVRRQHVLYLVVAIAGWLTDSMGLPARDVLGQMLRDALLD